MADTMRAALPGAICRPIYARDKDRAMLELMMIANMARSPLQVIARRWYCKSLFRATRGQRRCAGCGEP
jgi:hypothetical protein